MGLHRCASICMYVCVYTKDIRMYTKTAYFTFDCLQNIYIYIYMYKMQAFYVFRGR